jgi:hypothetical protein
MEEKEKKSEKKEKKISLKIYIRFKHTIYIVCNTAETCDTAVTGRGVPSGPEFGNRTCTCGNRDCDTAELPAPVLHPKHHHATKTALVVHDTVGPKTGEFQLSFPQFILFNIISFPVEYHMFHLVCG